MWAEEALGLLSRAEGGRGLLRLGVWVLDRFALTCCRLSSLSCCLLKDVPLAILHHKSSLREWVVVVTYPMLGVVTA